jgi:hypothetical protein
LSKRAFNNTFRIRSYGIVATETSLKEGFPPVYLIDKRKGGKHTKTKRALIVLQLVEESAEKTNEEIEKEILEALSVEVPVIPWLKSVEKVTVLEE